MYLETKLQMVDFLNMLVIPAFLLTTSQPFIKRSLLRSRKDPRIRQGRGPIQVYEELETSFLPSLLSNP